MKRGLIDVLFGRSVPLGMRHLVTTTFSEEFLELVHTSFKSWCCRLEEGSATIERFYLCTLHPAAKEKEVGEQTHTHRHRHTHFSQ